MSCPVNYEDKEADENRPSGKARGRLRSPCYGEAEQRSMTADFAANYRANLRDRTLGRLLRRRRLGARHDRRLATSTALGLELLGREEALFQALDLRHIHDVVQLLEGDQRVGTIHDLAAVERLLQKLQTALHAH